MRLRGLSTASHRSKGGLLRILQLGVGSVGEVTARTLASIPEVDTVVLADMSEQRLAQVAPKLPGEKVKTLPLDADDRQALVQALAGVDLLVNALIPEYNLDIMAACLETGTHYLDRAAAGPRDIVDTADVDEEIEFEAAWFRPLDLLVSRLPRSVDLIGRMHGAACVGTPGEGTIAGKRVRRFMYQTTSQDEAFEPFGVQGTGFQTGVPAAAAAIMLARGLITEAGVLPPERIDPQPFLDIMTEFGAPWGVVDLPPE